MRERLEPADLFSIRAISFADGDVAPFIEEDVSQFSLVAEGAFLRLPFRLDAEISFDSVDMDRRIVWCFNDGHVTSLAIRHAPEGHTDTVAAIGRKPSCLDRFVINGIGYPFVHRDHQVRTGLGDKRMRKTECPLQVSFSEELQCEFGTFFVQPELHLNVHIESGLTPDKVDSVRVPRCVCHFTSG